MSASFAPFDIQDKKTLFLSFSLSLTFDCPAPRLGSSFPFACETRKKEEQKWEDRQTDKRKDGKTR